ncbi:hypothetical protein AVEN_164693-1 [Araneus ventricosus]|uniref:Uncharacterized protein n=1 Tax=Araneus ventricosus TaxID=182803 RepID=A0A4Y2RXA2_ARAVE|nr:hypothetical protein AVEN_164693-1 [Araneus ventricosus]
MFLSEVSQFKAAVGLARCHNCVASLFEQVSSFIPQNSFPGHDFRYFSLSFSDLEAAVGFGQMSEVCRQSFWNDVSHSFLKGILFLGMISDISLEFLRFTSSYYFWPDVGVASLLEQSLIHSSKFFSWA